MYMRITTVNSSDLARYGTWGVREVQALQSEERRLKRQLTPREIQEKRDRWQAYLDEATGKSIV